MDYLPTIADIAITLFALTYFVRLFWQPNIISKKKIFKKTLEKTQIDLWSMEMNQAVTQNYRREIMKEKENLEKQKKDLEELKARQEQDLKELESLKNVQNWEDIKAKKLEIKETEAELAKNAKETEQATNASKWLARQIAEITKQRSTKERSLQTAKYLVKKLS